MTLDALSFLPSSPASSASSSRRQDRDSDPDQFSGLVQKQTPENSQDPVESRDATRPENTQQPDRSETVSEKPSAPGDESSADTSQSGQTQISAKSHSGLTESNVVTLSTVIGNSVVTDTPQTIGATPTIKKPTVISTVSSTQAINAASLQGQFATTAANNNSGIDAKNQLINLVPPEVVKQTTDFSTPKLAEKTLPFKPADLQLTAHQKSGPQNVSLNSSVDGELLISSKTSEVSVFDGKLFETRPEINTTTSPLNSFYKFNAQPSVTPFPAVGNLPMETEPLALIQTTTATNSPQIPTNSLTPVAVSTAVRADAAAQVADAIRIHTTDQKLTLRLDPPELGRVGIELTFDNSRLVTAMLTAEQADTTSLLRRSIENLYRELNEAGFEGVQIDVAHQEKPQTSDGEPAPGEDKNLLHAMPQVKSMLPKGQVNIIRADHIDARF